MRAFRWAFELGKPASIPFKRINLLLQEAVRIFFHLIEPQLDFTAVLRHISSAEEIVPDAQTDAIVGSEAVRHLLA